MWAIPDLKAREVLSVIALQMAKAQGLILTRLIKRELKKMSIAATFIEHEPAGFISLMVEKNHSSRPSVRSGHYFAVNDPGMLTFPIGNHHS